MDPLSISTGVAGLIGLALQVAPILHAYISDVASARTDIQTYLREVDALSQVSELLHSFLDTPATVNGQFQTTEAVLLQTIKSCETCLMDLVRILSKPTSLSRRLLWSMEKQKVEIIMERLRRYTQLFHFALSVEGWAVLSQTPAEVTAILEMQMQMSKKMQEIVRVTESAKVYREKTEQVAAVLEHMRLLFADEGERLMEIQERVEDISRGLRG
ncbi:hypothetical protein BO78DRAFT_163082 [Aspergillus sclerotiicarbonarius CBS 121057]|uniref:Azaphilone pigments biosynthesis cluster protein L N-terminal domain-containing protein n=1 Tax=Aspergillus sclerotiicarbonarius (strain CBS 121057 / IBT 28362) TaxID=1448318 RepID=A0A319ELF5_ASPSB|nr:hypothetical protein BO78DRAFT_163082 [Aspergillus sclerotiicarbonarius CBS 121057]